MPRKNSYITATDQFCGAGGSTSGAKAAGVEVRLALNHWKLAIETHNTNHPTTDHDCTDIQACDPRRYPSTDILITSPECFPAGTLIVTTQGLKQIQDIKIDDMVLTHKGRWRPVTHTMKTNRDTLFIKGQGHAKLEVSKEHPFYVREQTQVWDNAKRDYNRRVFGDPVFEEAKNLLSKKYRWATPFKFPKIPIPPVKGKNARGVEFSSKFWWMIGRWLGDGSIRIRKNHSNEITICCGKHEVEQLSELNLTTLSGGYAKRNEIKWRKREIRTAYLFECAHDSLGSWLVDNFGKGSYGKTIPSWVFSMSVEWRTSLLNGYVSADGSVNDRYTQTNSVSKSLALGIKLLACSLGYHPLLGCYKHKGGEIEGRRYNDYSLWLVRWENNKSQREGFNDGTHLWTLVKNIEQARKNVEVFNISVMDDESYVADGIVVHNCTNHSLAKGKTRKMQGQADLFGIQQLDPAAERSRATMWDVVRFAEYHSYNAIITENVVDARYWRLWDAWILAMHNLGYAHKCVYMNSMFHYPTPQSRDRMYVVFWKRGNKAPDLEFSPAAHCPDCGRDVEARQHWKPGRNFGKYKTQYIYRCPNCHREVSPYYYAAFNAIDWTIPSVRIGDRPKPLSPNTLNRIQAGLDKYSGNVFVSTSSYDQLDRGLLEAMTTQTGQQNKSIVIPMVIQTEHSQVHGLVRPSHYPIFTQTTRQSMGIVIPMLVGNYSPGWVRDTMQPSGTVTCSDHHGLLTAPVIVENFGKGTARSAMDRMGCITAGGINYGILTSKSMSAFLAAYYSGSNTLAPIVGQSPTVTTVERIALVEPQDSVRIEDCHYRMLVSKEVQACMAFPNDYIVLGSSRDQVRQLGNAVTPPAMEWLVKNVVESLN